MISATCGKKAPSSYKKWIRFIFSFHKNLLRNICSLKCNYFCLLLIIEMIFLTSNKVVKKKNKADINNLRAPCHQRQRTDGPTDGLTDQPKKQLIESRACS